MILQISIKKIQLICYLETIDDEKWSATSAVFRIDNDLGCSNKL